MSSSLFGRDKLKKSSSGINEDGKGFKIPPLKRPVPGPEEKEATGFKVNLKKVKQAAPPSDEGTGFNVKLKKVQREEKGEESDSSVASVQLKKVEKRTVKKTTVTVDSEGKVKTNVEESTTTKTSTDRIGLKKRTVEKNEKSEGIEGVKLKKVSPAAPKPADSLKGRQVGKRSTADEEEKSEIGGIKLKKVVKMSTDVDSGSDAEQPKLGLRRQTVAALAQMERRGSLRPGESDRRGSVRRSSIDMR
ncbi:hypothetical protein PMAYCL1PPCAC_19015, partial [Pristionchus mayeri]